jgi:Photosynthetic reaction centre cytochrome C subunit
MKSSWRFVAAGLVSVWIAGIAYAVKPSAQAVIPSPPPGAIAGTFFKNVTTSTLKTLTVDDFIAAMGVMSGALGWDCADCHPGAGTDTVDWVVDTRVKRTARRMVEMVDAINKAQFAGVQKVTCWTCHHGRDIPASSIMLDRLYEAPNDELDDLVIQDKDQPQATVILDKYIAALGGAQRLAGLTSYIASGTSLGFGEFGGTADFTIFAKSPDKRTTLINYKDHPDRGESLWTVSGNTGTVKTPRALLRDYTIVGEELDGQMFEAKLAFPGKIKEALTNWRVGQPRAIGSKDYAVVQGNGPRGFMATLYFDQDTGLLARMVRYGSSPVGHVLTQTDYGDYREVNGIKFPFAYKFSWLDGRFSATLKEVRVNAAIPDTRFGKPQ